MKNRLEDLNNHLFTQLERLNAEDLKGDEDIERETKRAHAVVALSRQVIDTRRVTVDAAKLVYEATGSLPNGANAKLLGHDDDTDAL